MNKLPCINCICLPICKSRLSSFDHTYSRSVRYLSIIKLAEYCSILKTSMINKDNYIDDNDLLREIYGFLKTGYVDVTKKLIRENTSGTL